MLNDEREFSLFVVGINYPNENGSNRRFELTVSTPGEPVELRREPKNKHDPQAVAVFSARGHQIGYLSGERCGWIGGMLLSGVECHAIFQDVDEHVAVIRARFGGGEPTLPLTTGARRAPADEPDFYPDPDPGDWPA